MTNVFAFSILAITVSLSLGRPRIGRVRIHHSSAAIIGALLTVSLQLVSLDSAFAALKFLAIPVITIVSLMVITLIAEQAGIMELLARKIAKVAEGDGHKLFAYLFFTGTLTGTIFTNDAAVLIYTPLVFNLIEEVQEPSWSGSNKIPYYFAVLYVANVVGAFVISNPINIVVSSLFKVGFAEYASWMIVPAVVSVILSFVGIRFFFKKSIPATYRPPEKVSTNRGSPGFRLACGIVLSLTLVAFFSEGITGVPTWLVALTSALILIVVNVFRGQSPVPVVRQVSWDVIIFVVGIFIVAMGLRNAGLTAHIGELITYLAGTSTEKLTFATGLLAAVCSSIINNHPTADMMSWVIRGFSASAIQTKMLVFSALIGGDLGPKMLPIGSLAAMMWFGILRKRGVEIPYRLYIKIGIPVTLIAIVLSIVTLNIEYMIYQAFTR